MRLLLIIATLIISNCIYCQFTRHNISMSTGVSVSRLELEKRRAGLFAGLTYLYKQDLEMYGIFYSTGIEYESKGGREISKKEKYHVDEVVYSKHKEIIHDFISVPLSIGYYFDDELIGSARVGILPRYMMKNKLRRTWQNDALVITDITEEDVTQDYNRFYLSGLFQLSIGYALNSFHSISGLARYSWGMRTFGSLNDTYKNTYDDSSFVIAMMYTYTFKQR